MYNQENHKLDSLEKWKDGNTKTMWMWIGDIRKAMSEKRSAWRLK